MTRSPITVNEKKEKKNILESRRPNYGVRSGSTTDNFGILHVLHSWFPSEFLLALSSIAFWCFVAWLKS